MATFKIGAFAAAVGVRDAHTFALPLVSQNTACTPLAS